jgi:hypothetical protein
MAFGSTWAKLFGGQRPTAGFDPGSGAPAKADGARSERRALVNQAVCEAMSAAGVPSSSYKRDIQLLDAPGRQARVNIDLADELAGLDAGKLAHYGTAISKRVADLCGTEVTAVYWRLNPAASAPYAGRPTAAAPDAVEQRLATLHEQVPDSVPFEDSAMTTDFAKTVPGEMIDLHSVRRK